MKRKEFTHSIVRRFQLAAKLPQCKSILIPDTANILPESASYGPLLPPLPSDIRLLAKQFDKMMLDNAIDRAKSVAKLSAKNNIPELPFSKLKPDTHKVSIDCCSWTRWLTNKNSGESVDYQAPLMAISDRKVRNIEQFVAVCRDDILFENSWVPQLISDEVVIDLGDGSTGKVPLVNGFCPDLIHHGKMRRVIEIHEIPSSEVYYVLQGLNTSLSQLAAALSIYEGIPAPLIHHIQLITSRCQYAYDRVRGMA